MDQAQPHLRRVFWYTFHGGHRQVCFNELAGVVVKVF